MKWRDPDRPPEYQDKVLLATTRPPVTESPDRLRGFRFGYWSASSGKWHIDEGWDDERVVGWMPLIGMPHPADPTPPKKRVRVIYNRLSSRWRVVAWEPLPEPYSDAPAAAPPPKRVRVIDAGSIWRNAEGVVTDGPRNFTTAGGEVDEIVTVQFGNTDLPGAPPPQVLATSQVEFIPPPPVEPTPTGRRFYPPDGYYLGKLTASEIDRGAKGTPCTCKPTCGKLCAGDCGCRACETVADEAREAGEWD